MIAEAIDWAVFIGFCAGGAGVGAALGVPPWGVWLVALVAAPVLLMACEIVAIASCGQTLGKRIAGLKVLRLDTLEVPGLRRAAKRTLCLAPWSWLSYRYQHEQRVLVGRATGLPDRLAGTIVVNDRARQSTTTQPVR